MKLRIKTQSKYRKELENIDVFTLLLNSEKYNNNKQFILSLLNNKLKINNKNINEILNKNIQNLSEFYSNKLSFFNISTKEVLDFEGQENFLPDWYINGDINKYYFDNVIDNELIKDLNLLKLKNNEQVQNKLKFEILEFENLLKLLKEGNNEVVYKKSKILFWFKILFFILVVIAIILMVLFFII